MCAAQSWSHGTESAALDRVTYVVCVTFSGCQRVAPEDLPIWNHIAMYCVQRLRALRYIDAWFHIEIFIAFVCTQKSSL